MNSYKSTPINMILDDTIASRNGSFEMKQT